MRGPDTPPVSSVPADESPATPTNSPPGRPRAPRREPVDDVYPRLAELGYHYGPAFQGLTSVWRRGTSTFAEIRLPEPVRGSAQRYRVHPALLDMALHALVLGAAPDGDTEHINLPFNWTDVTLHRVARPNSGCAAHPTPTAPRLWCSPSRTARSWPRSGRWPCGRCPGSGIAAATDGVADALFTVDWRGVPVPTEDLSLTWAEHGTGTAADIVVADVDTPRAALRLVQEWLADDGWPTSGCC